MNMQRRFGLLTATVGAALTLGSLTFAGSATAVEPVNFADVPGNITVCPTGTTQFDGQVHSGTGSTASFHWAVTDDTYVTITQIDPTVTGLTAYIKGGPNYRIYNPVIAGQQMRSPLNGGDNIPALSHWFLCYGTTPVVTTTTTVPEIVTTTTIADVVTTTTTIADVVTTTTVPDVVTTTTVPEIVTTTTIGESGGPTTTLAATTTTEQAAEGPTTTVDDGPLPTTGGSTSPALALGLALTLGGLVLAALTRTPRRS